MKRKTSPLKILLFLCLLTIAVVLGGRLVLSSDWPRKKLQSVLSSQLGVDVGIGKFDFSRRGDTTFTDLTVKLPEDNSDFVNVKELHIKHNSLLDMVLNRRMEIYSIEMPSNSIRLWQMPDGSWNIAEIESLLSPGGTSSSSTNPLETLRDLKIKDFTVHIENASGEVITIPLSLQAEAQSGEKSGVLDLTFGAKLFGGSVQGNGTIDLIKLMETSAAIEWEDVDIGEIRKIFPKAEMLSGLVSGNMKIEPAVGKNALEPLLLEINITAHDGIFEDYQFKNAGFKGFAGIERLLITESAIQCLGGSFNPQARLSKHGDRLVLYINSDFTGIDANKLIHAIGIDADPIAGQISGKGFIVTSLDFDSINGTVDLTMEQMNLADNDIISTLYGVVRPNSREEDYTGSGAAKIRFDGVKIAIDDFYYFNRGFEVYGSGRIADTSLGQQSPVSGVVFGTIRPFKDVSIIGAKTVDKTMLMLQSNLASVRISGTIESNEIRVVALPDMQSAINAIMSGKSPF